jgi:hypothetical protein
MVDIHNPEDVDDPSLDGKGVPERFMYQDEDGTFYEVQGDGSEYTATRFGESIEVESINYDSGTEAQSDINLNDALEELTAKSDKTMAEPLNR